MSKIRLSIIADAGAPTGFATVTHQIAWYLQETGEYDINILGINFSGKPNEWSKKLTIWPAKLGGDSLGMSYAQSFFEETKPDIRFLFQDFWNIPHYLADMRPGTPGVVAYYPVDSPNIKGNYMLSLGAAAEVACYTDFGVQESVRGTTEGWETVKDQAKTAGLDKVNLLTINVAGAFDTKSSSIIGGGDVVVPAKQIKKLLKKDTYNVIPHGIDVTKFFPVDAKVAREKLNMDLDWFIVGNVNRNQSRKRQDLTIQAFAEFAEDKPNARLVLHCVRMDPRGWDLVQLAEYYGVKDKLIMTHDLFEEMTATLEELNLVYNSFDVQVNTCGGEGFGLTNFEGAACRVPQIVPDWSATKEIWEGSGLLIDVVAVRHEMALINTAQAVIDVHHLVTMLNELYESPDKLQALGDSCWETTQRPEYTWESVGEKFDRMFRRAIGKAPLTGDVALTAKGQKELTQKQSMKFK
jgi:glycosyltransferase involved in cell wall biosynthesis